MQLINIIGLVDKDKTTYELRYIVSLEREKKDPVFQDKAVAAAVATNENIS